MHGCMDKNSVILSLSKETNRLSFENDKMQQNIKTLCNEIESMHLEKKQRQSFSVICIRTEKKMRFFTRIQSLAIFNAVYDILKPHVSKVLNWRGSKRIYASKGKKLRKFTPHKLCGKDQFLLRLMKIRLGLMNKDSADRF